MLLIDLTCLTLAALFGWAFFHSKGMGLHRDIPPTPEGRAKLFASRILEHLKDQLRGSVLVSARQGEVQFMVGSERRRIDLTEGYLRLQVPGQDTKNLGFLGRDGRIDFKQVGTALRVDVQSWAEATVPRSFQVHIPLHDAPTPSRRLTILRPRLF